MYILVSLNYEAFFFLIGAAQPPQPAGRRAAAPAPAAARASPERHRDRPPCHRHHAGRPTAARRGRRQRLLAAHAARPPPVARSGRVPVLHGAPARRADQQRPRRHAAGAPARLARLRGALVQGRPTAGAPSARTRVGAAVQPDAVRAAHPAGAAGRCGRVLVLGAQLCGRRAHVRLRARGTVQRPVLAGATEQVDVTSSRYGAGLECMICGLDGNT